MGQILQNWRILTSAFLSVAFIIGAFLLARGIESPRGAQASTESALLQAIATKDSDGDGLTDWEEALYGTDSHVTDTFKLGMTDGEAVAKGLVVPKAIADIVVATSSPLSVGVDGLPPPPAEETLTAAFAKNFFTLYLSAKQAKGGSDLSQSEVSSISNEALSSLSSAVTSSLDYKSAKDIAVSGSGADALKMFAANVEAVLKKNTANATTSEIIYLQYAVENNDVDALAHIASIAKAYRDSSAGIVALTAPQELAIGSLALVNAMMRVSNITSDFARVNTDPLTAMFALQQYVVASQSLQEALADIGSTYDTAGIVLPDGTPGSSFLHTIANITERQRAADNNL